MTENLQDILTENQFKELMLAIADNKDYNLLGKNFNLKVQSTENSLSFNLDYKEDLVQDFKNFLSEIDDDLFLAITENLGTKKLNYIENCLNSKDDKVIKEGIGLFKMEYRRYVNNKINYYQKCLNNLDK